MVFCQSCWVILVYYSHENDKPGKKGKALETPKDLQQAGKKQQEEEIGLRMKIFFLRHRRIFIIIGVAIVVGVFAPQVLDTTKPIVIKGERVPIIWIYDGDTIRVRINDTLENVRLLGIDTPEVDTPYTTEECFGPEASEYTKALLMGKEVVLQADEEGDNRDKFDRLLRYVYLIDGTFVNAQLIDEGYARTYRNAEYSYREDFLEREAEAQKEGAGLWSAC